MLAITAELSAFHMTQERAHVYTCALCVLEMLSYENTHTVYSESN